MSYTGAVPDTVRPADWRERAACRADRDAMHPDNNQAGIAHARQICAACPVPAQCLADAIRTGDNEWGIRAGLKPEQRRQAAKRLNTEQLDDLAAVAAVMRRLVVNPSGRTLRDIWDERSRVLPGGHLGWVTATASIMFEGRVYTPKQVAFVLDRGRPPVGIVRGTCGVDGCVHPRHLADNEERALSRRAAEAGQAEG